MLRTLLLLELMGMMFWRNNLGYLGCLRLQTSLSGILSDDTKEPVFKNGCMGVGGVAQVNLFILKACLFWGYSLTTFLVRLYSSYPFSK
jgi:hypothetical protein